MLSRQGQHSQINGCLACHELQHWIANLLLGLKANHALALIMRDPLLIEEQQHFLNGFGKQVQANHAMVIDVTADNATYSERVEVAEKIQGFSGRFWRGNNPVKLPVSEP